MNYIIVAIVILSLGVSVLKVQKTQIAGKQATPPPTQSFGTEAYSSIFPLEMKADSNFNTGDVYLSVLKGGEGSLIANFLFEPGSRNYWHLHPGTVQTLLVLDGEGYYQEEGKPRQVIRQGDVIVTPADVLHWNGATPGSRLSCMTVTEPSDSKHAVQVRAVTDEEY